MTLMRKMLLLGLLLFGIVSILGPPGSLRAEEMAQEYQLKAAFLVNFAKFITWPPQAFPPGQQEFVLCVAGDNPFGTALTGLENKTIAGHPIRMVQVESLKKVPPCHLLFVSRSEDGNLGQLTSVAGRRPIVTVSDIAGFVKAGGHIEFVTKGSRLSFVINHSAMKEQGIQASASLLDLAAAVQ
jgi:hypothetical protein